MGEGGAWSKVQFPTALPVSLQEVDIDAMATK